MTIALQSPPRRTTSRLQDASLLNGPMLLLKSIRGFSSHRSLMWLACVPVAFLGLGLFNLSAHASELPELNAAFLANNLWLLVATILVIFMNAGFAMVEAGMCRQKNAVNILEREHIRNCVLFLGCLLLRKITVRFKNEIRLEMRISLDNS